MASSLSTPIDEPFVELELLLELLAAEPERRARARRQLGLEVAAVALERVGGFHRRVGQVAQQVQVVHAGERARQVVLDELQHAAQRLEPDLGVDARRLLDVVARRLDQPRRLAELRQDAARPLVLGGVREDRLRRPGSSPGRRRRTAGSAPRSEPLRSRRSGPGCSRRSTGCSIRSTSVSPSSGISSSRRANPDRARACDFERAPAQVLEQVVVRVHAVERRAGRLGFVEIPQVVVDEMMKWFG